MLGAPVAANFSHPVRPVFRRILAVATIRQTPKLVTIVIHGNTSSQTLSDVQTGSRIRVYGSLNGSTLMAERIELDTSSKT